LDRNIVRTGSKDLLVSAKGLSFDAFLRFEHQIGDNQFMAIDVYTRARLRSYVLYSIMCLALNREAAENTGRTDKAVSPTYFNT
jgi:hypothetical protein